MIDALQALIDERKNLSFVEGYQATDEEGLGLVIAHHFEWDGLAILKSAMYALEDANFHTEAGLIADMIKQEEQA
jgi:hypothetical protein